MLAPMKLKSDEVQKVYSRAELYDLARNNNARVIAYREIETDRFKIVNTISGGCGSRDFVMWQDEYGHDLIIRNLIIAESVPADDKR